MICKKCGAEYPDDAVKCPFCEAETVAHVEDAETVAEAEVAEPAVEVVPTEEEFVMPSAQKKSKKGLWIAGIAVVVLAIAAAVFGIASNMYYTSANDERASVYVITKKEMDKVYAKVGTGEAHLVKELGENEAFNENSEFVVKNNNIYFLNDDGGLSIMNMKNGKTKVIGDDFKAGTIVLSAKGDTLLYVGEDGILYKTTKGRQARVLIDIGESNFANTLPNYGFVEGTNTAWYAPREADQASGTVYIESGENIAEKAAAVFHVGDEGNTVVYTTVTKEETVDPENTETAEGEEPAEPVIVRSYALMIKEEGKEPEVLNDDYADTDSVSILHKEHKGVLYLADKGDAPADPETGEVIGVAAGTLYFRQFGGETTKLDTEVSVALLLDDLSGTNYYYDASDRAEDETVAYMKNDTISLIRDMKIVENPAEFEFLSSTPVFKHDNTFMLYKTYNPTPVREESEAEPAENEQPEAVPVKLVYTNLTDGAWADYTVVAEDVVDYSYDEDNGKIYYLLNENDSTEKLSLYCHTVETGENVQLANDVLGYVTFNEKGKNLYYIHNFNSETQTASLSIHKNGEPKAIATDLSGCLMAKDGTPYIVVPNGEDTDFYYIDGDGAELVTKKMTNILYVR